VEYGFRRVTLIDTVTGFRYHPLLGICLLQEPSHAPEPTRPEPHDRHPLGEDVLLLRAMRGKERLSTLFKYKLDLISESRQPIRPEDLLGQPVTVRLDLPDHRTRYFNGIVNRFSHSGFDGDLAVYRATLVPRLWLLTRTTDCRIFQQKRVPDIVREIRCDHGYTDCQDFLVGELYRPWNYCV